MIQLTQRIADAHAEGWGDWIRSDADERAVLDGCWFDPAAGEWWVGFFEKFLRHTMGKFAGRQFTLLPWQRDEVIMPLFGWKRDRERRHVRRYSKGDIFVAKKQGKSTIAAGLVNGFLMGGGHRAEVYGVAHTRDQASIIYREAAAMATSSPALSKHLKVIDSRKRIVYPAKQSFYQALAGESNARGVEGINPILILFDEIHVQRSRELYDALTYASAARENSLMLSVSTVGVADETTIWWEQYAYAKGILSGEIHDNARFAFIAQADEECKDSAELRRDPEQWRKAMPSLGMTVTEEKVEEAVREAENSPAKLNNLLRYMFNIPTAQVDRVIPMDRWYACQWDEEEQGEWPDLSGRECYGGLDVASSEDLTAFSLYFPPIDDEEHGYLVSHFWCPEAKIRERQQKQMAHYGQWVRESYLSETGDETIDHEVISSHIVQAAEQYHILEVAYDKWNAGAVVTRLEHEFIETLSVEQGYVGMSSHAHTFINAIVDGTFWHDGNAVMSWCCSNAAADTLEEAIRFSKKNSADKIDGVVSAAMAMGRATLAEAESIYDEPGQLTL